MGDNLSEFTQRDLRREPGRRGGCSCCGFTAMGLMALPLLVVVLIFAAL